MLLPVQCDVTRDKQSESLGSSLATSSEEGEIPEELELDEFGSLVVLIFAVLVISANMRGLKLKVVLEPFYGLQAAVKKVS